MRAVEVTRAWVSEIVVGLNLCPFAERALNKTRFTQSDAETPEDLLLALGKELQLIASAPRQEIYTRDKSSRSRQANIFKEYHEIDIKEGRNYERHGK
jgi:hypothetical protein